MKTRRNQSVEFDDFLGRMKVVMLQSIFVRFILRYETDHLVEFDIRIVKFFKANVLV